MTEAIGKWVVCTVEQRDFLRYMAYGPDGSTHFLGFSEEEAKKSLRECKRVYRMSDSEYEEYLRGR